MLEGAVAYACHPFISPLGVPGGYPDPPPPWGIHSPVVPTDFLPVSPPGAVRWWAVPRRPRFPRGPGPTGGGLDGRGERRVGLAPGGFVNTAQREIEVSRAPRHPRRRNGPALGQQQRA